MRILARPQTPPQERCCACASAFHQADVQVRAVEEGALRKSIGDVDYQTELLEPELKNIETWCGIDLGFSKRLAASIRERLPSFDGTLEDLGRIEDDIIDRLDMCGRRYLWTAATRPETTGDEREPKRANR